MAITHAQFVTMLQKVGKLYKEALVDFGRETSTDNVIAMVDAIKSNALGDWSDRLERQAAAWRSRYAALVSGGQWRALLDPVFRALLRDLAENKGNLDPAANWSAIYDYFADGSYSIKNRGIIFDTSPTATGTGGGTAYRLTVDRYAQALEGCYAPLDISLLCVSTDPDAVGEEVFQATAPAPTDVLDRGTGVTFDPAATLQALNSDGSFLSDASFQLATAAVADPSDLGAWVDSAGTYGSAKYALSTTTAISSVEETRNGQALALEIKGNHTIEQDLDGIDLFTPYYWTMRVRPGSSLSAGTLTVHWGTQTQAYNLASLTAGSYNLVAPTLDKDLYGWNWAGDGATAKFKLVVSGLTGDTVLIDAIRFRPMDFAFGTWWTIESEAVSFQSGTNEKKLVFNDTLAGSDSVLQPMIHLAYGRHLPSASSPTIADP